MRAAGKPNVGAKRGRSGSVTGATAGPMPGAAMRERSGSVTSLTVGPMPAAAAAPLSKGGSAGGAGAGKAMPAVKRARAQPAAAAAPPEDVDLGPLSPGSVMSLGSSASVVSGSSGMPFSEDGAGSSASSSSGGAGSSSSSSASSSGGSYANAGMSGGVVPVPTKMEWELYAGRVKKLVRACPRRAAAGGAGRGGHRGGCL
jgi:hypothetical protein